MKLRVYDSKTNNFNNNGLGSLNDAFNASVKEVANGELSLTFSYPVDGIRFESLKNENLVVAKPNSTDEDHAFRIINSIPDFSGMYTTIVAETKTNDLRGVPVDNFVSNDNGITLASKINYAFPNPSGIVISSDVKDKGEVNLQFTNLLALVMGTDSSLFNAVGGELKRSNNKLELLTRRGRDYPIKFSLHKNISGIKITTDTSSVITGILPYVTYTDSDQKDVTIVGDILKAGNANDYAVQKIQPTSIPSRRSTDNTSSSDLSLPIVENKEQLMTAAKAYYQGTSFVNSSYPNVTIDISVASVQKSTEYKQFENITDIGLFDTVKVDLSDYGLSYDMKVTEIEYDPITERVITVTLGKNKKTITESVQSQISQVAKNVENVTKVANATAISSNGKNTNYYTDEQPTNPVEGDLWFQEDGDYQAIWIYQEGQWKRISDSNTQAEIKEAVELTLEQAKENADQAIADNNVQINETINRVSKEQADLAIKDGDFNNKAQAMADKALSDAKANTATVAQQTLENANSNLASAKESLTNDLQKEVNDRTQDVSKLDTKAKGYADSAKNDAIAAATTADGTINKKIDDTASGLTTTISQNKADADGKIKTAQTTATQALNEVSTKVSQTEYNTKTSELTTNVNNVTQTANQSKQDIVAINQKNGDQDARMNTIESDANGTKATVSNIQTTQGKQSGDISTLQQRADGFDATVTKVNNLSTGDRNYVLDTGNPKIQTSNGKDNQDFYNSALFYSPIKNWGIANGDYIISFDWTLKTALSNDMNASVFFNQSPWQEQKFNVKSGQLTGHVNLKLKLWSSILTATQDVTSLTFRIMSQMASGNTITYSNLFMKSGTLDTSWTPAPEDLSSATAKAQLTADQATTSLNNYKTDADGRITKAQSDITQTAKDVTTKVSQTDYDKKTGDLSTSVSKAQQTADSAVTTIGNYKTSNDNRVKATETQIAQNTKDITLKASTSDLDSAKKDYNAQIAQVNVNANAITSQVSGINSKVNNLSQINLIDNSDFRPDLGGWNGFNTGLGTLTTGDYDYSGNHVMVMTSNSTNMARVYSAPIPLKGITTISYSFYYYLFSVPSSATVNFQITYLDKDLKQVAWANPTNVASNGTGKWINSTVNGTTLKSYDNAVYIAFTMDVRGNSGIKVGLSKPILVSGNTVGDYIPGQYNNNTAIAAQQVTINGITDTVSKQGANIDSITSRVQTAEGNISTATNNISGLQTKVTQTSNQISQEITDRTNGDKNTLQSSKDFTQSSITSAVNGVNSTITQTANGIIANIGATNLFPNSEFTKDYYRSKTGTVTYLANQNIDGQYHGVVRVQSTAASYQGYWAKNIPVTGGKKYSASVKVHFTNNGLTNGTAMLDLWFVDKSGTRVGSASRFTGQTSSPYWIDIVNDGFTAPINAANMQMSLIVNNAGAGMVADFTMPTFTATDVHQPYTPNDDISAQLSLLKDNWSIGIADNVNAITSGIVGNNSSMSLISKNVIIDSPSTQITGTAWIKTAMIADGQISTAKIGDASITSAKISDLDVNKLTGNVSNFIQSNWNGLYGSTYITSDGMTVSSGSTTTSFGSQGMRITMASSGGVVIQGSTKSNGTQTGVLIGMNVGSTFTSFGFQSSSNYLYNDEMVILKTGSQAAADYNIGGGVAFNHNVSLMDNIYIKPGKGFFMEWGKPGKAIFFNTINSGIPAIVTPAGSGLAFGSGGQLYLLSHNGWEDYNNTSIKGSFKTDYINVSGDKG